MDHQMVLSNTMSNFEELLASQIVDNGLPKDFFPTNASWQAPSLGYMKINFDGVVN